MTEDKERFDEIRYEIQNLIEEALSLLPENLQSQAESYWYAQMCMALYNDHQFLGSSGCSMEDTYKNWEESNEVWDDSKLTYTRR